MGPLEIYGAKLISVADFPHGFSRSRPPGTAGEAQKVRFGPAQEPAEAGAEKISAEKERGKGVVI